MPPAPDAPFDGLDSRSDLRKSMDTLFPQQAGDQCRVCNEQVVDGRWNYCSKRCRRIANAVQRMFVWEEVRERIIERDERTCQRCGVSEAIQWRAYWAGYERSRELGDDDTADMDEVPEAPTDSFLHVDHITPIDAGGHPFDATNLQTLCKHCHRAKTAAENRTRNDPDSRPEVGLDAFME